MQNPELVIMAAGMGSRYGGLKQMDPVAKTGEFILDFSDYDAIRAGFEKVVFVIKEEMLEDFKDTVGKRIEGKIKIEYAFQKPDRFVGADRIPEGRVKPWGTTHALLATRNVVKNATDKDGVTNAAMVGYVLGNTLTENGSVSRGVCTIGEDGMLKDIVETTQIIADGDTAAYIIDDNKYPLPYETIVSMNFWGFTPSIFDRLAEDFENFLGNLSDNPLKKECYLPFSVDVAMKADKCTVKAYSSNAKWFGVTYGDDKPVVVKGIREMIDAGVYPDSLWK